MMGIMFDHNVKETKIISVYGLTVYGKINKYDWMGIIKNCGMENALITFRIVDNSGNDIFFMDMGNNCILQCRVDDTLDNFLWWIAEDHPDSYTIEKQVYKSLCSSDCLFNHLITNRKAKLKREEEEKKRHEVAEKERKEKEDTIKSYCIKKSLIAYFRYGKAYLIKAHNEKASHTFQMADDERMKSYIDFMRKHPDNTDAYIVKDGTIEEILKYIS